MNAAQTVQPLLVMGEVDGSAPLAAIYRTKYGRSFAPAAEENPVIEAESRLEEDTPIVEPLLPAASDESVSFDTDELPFGEAPTVEAPAVVGHDLIERLASVIPSGAAASWVNQLALGVADRDAKLNRTSSNGSWFVEVFNSGFFKTRPAKIGQNAMAEAEYTSQTLGLGRGDKQVLDVGGGYGRIALPLARTGSDITLLDLSQDMIAMALSLGEARKVELKTLHQDMRDLSAEAEYDCVRCGGGTFGYFSDAENLMLLSQLCQAVRPGGRVLVDVMNRDRAIQDLPNRGWWEGDGCLIQEDADFDLMRSRIEVKRLLVFSDGTQREANISIRLFAVHELAEMMRMVGLRVLDVTGAPQTEGTFFTTQSQRLMVTAERIR